MGVAGFDWRGKRSAWASPQVLRRGRPNDRSASAVFSMPCMNLELRYGGNAASC